LSEDFEIVFRPSNPEGMGEKPRITQLQRGDSKFAIGNLNLEHFASAMPPKSREPNKRRQG
jgi:hypothetical protein